MTDLSGKTAVITGASRGIGAAVARMLHDRGCNLGLASRSGSDLGLERAVASPCDVRDLDALVELCDATAERFGGIDIVVPNAGVGAYGPFLDLSREHLDEMLDVNLKGTVYAVRAALPHMLGREGDVVTYWPRRPGGAVFPTRLSTARRSSDRSGSRARSTTSFASTGFAAPTSAPAVSLPTSRSTTDVDGRPMHSPG